MQLLSSGLYQLQRPDKPDHMYSLVVKCTMHKISSMQILKYTTWLSHCLNANYTRLAAVEPRQVWALKLAYRQAATIIIMQLDAKMQKRSIPGATILSFTVFIRL